MWRKHRGRKAFFRTLPVFSLFLFGIFLWEQIPDSMYVAEEEDIESALDFPLDSLFLREVVEASGQEATNIPEGQVRIQCSLFGVIPFKSVQVDVCGTSSVIPGGEPVGIYMKTKGVLVVGTGEVTGEDGMTREPALNLVHSGDYIVKADGKNVETKEDLIRSVEESEGQEMVLTVSRNGTATELKITPVRTNGQDYKLGIWVRDDTQGIGTLTYVNGNGSFGALGHGISDVDTGTLLSLDEGTLYNTTIVSVIKGSQGVPGELSGVIRYRQEEILGKIEANTDRGIFGQMNEKGMTFETGEAVELGYKQDIHTGEAVIRSSISGELREYSIEIEKVNRTGHDVNKSMVIRVTDPSLLDLTGGIVQGMSGSPILQDGKLVGAVTHVFVNDASRGYGIFAETMAQAQEELH